MATAELINCAGAWNITEHTVERRIFKGIIGNLRPLLWKLSEYLKTKSKELQFALTKEVFVFILLNNKLKSAYIFQMTTKYLEKSTIL